MNTEKYYNKNTHRKFSLAPDVCVCVYASVKMQCVREDLLLTVGGSKDCPWLV